jgi:hypothetical protein
LTFFLALSAAFFALPETSSTLAFVCSAASEAVLPANPIVSEKL